MTMTHAEQLAAFVVRASYDDLTEAARQQLKIRVLDSLGCAIGGQAGEPTRRIRSLVQELGGVEHCTLIGGGRTAPDRAAFYNGALVRYLDFNDSYLAEGETCHPSDNLCPVLAVAEYAGRDGRELLTALAVAYQVQCRLCDVAPVRAKGFDHTTQGAYAVAAGASKALGLDRTQTTNAIAISGTAFNALRVTRTGALSHWKGLAYPNTAFGAIHATLLARHGITGPREVFEGNKGFMDAISGPFTIDWSREDLERVTRTILKKFNAEVHSQSTLEAVMELRRMAEFAPTDIERVEIEIFDVAFNIIGGGEEGDKAVVRLKEEADHSLPYLVAVALLDGEVMPEQYRPARIERPDVQALLRRVSVRPVEAFSRRFPEKIPCRVRVTLQDGRRILREQEDYEGFRSRPMRWEMVVEKFERLASAYADPALRREIAGTVNDLEAVKVSDLTALLGRVRAATD
jgi:2-methylcitrate dehydratase